MVLDMNYGDQVRDNIFRKIGDIESQLAKLQENRDEDFTDSMKTALEETHNQLRKCETKCRRITDQMRAEKFFFSNFNKELLRSLLTELDRINNNLETKVISAMAEQLCDIRLQVKDARNEIKSDVVYPRAGVYSIRNVDLKPPVKPSRPVVDIEGEQMIIRWEDDGNPPDSLKKYEIRLDESTNYLIPTSDGSCRCLSIGPPKIKPGIVYTIQVRGINGGGPGEWSDPAIARFKTAPPNKPEKPRVTPGYNDAKVSVRVPGIKETNGEPVNQIIVQNCEIENTNMWSSTSFPIRSSQHNSTITISDLSPNTLYCFRIILVNECGESTPSESVDVTTDIPIPGKPTNLRQSSYSTSDLLKIRWSPPEENAEFVHCYEVKYKEKSKDLDTRYNFEVIHTTKPSATAKGLESNTTYVFYVRAMNENNKFSKDVKIEATTRWSKAIKLVLSPFVFLGGMVSGPIAGAAGGEALGASLSDSAVGTVAGAVGGAVSGGIAGTVGAPLVGGMAAHYFVHGIPPESDQSDDEN